MTPTRLPLALGFVTALLGGAAGWSSARESIAAPQCAAGSTPGGEEEPQDAKAQEADRASRIKAGMVLNFIRYTDWPGDAFASADSAVVITVLGEGEIRSALEQTLSGQHVHDRPVEIRRLSYPEPPSGGGEIPEDRLREFIGQLRASHVLFVCSSEQARIGPVLQSVDGSNVLTVSDIDAFATHGGMLGLAIRNDRVAFDANPDQIQETDLKVSSQLLRLAKTVKTRSQ
jgi:hypothetical protein